jgi:hypothetical protein
MSNLFFDSDIILDIVLQRQPHFEASADLFKLCGEGKYQCCASVHSLLNVHYFAKKVHGEYNTRQSLQMLTKVIDVVAENSSHIQQALNLLFTTLKMLFNIMLPLALNLITSLPETQKTIIIRPSPC